MTNNFRFDAQGEALLAALAKRGVYSVVDLEIWERDLRERNLRDPIEDVANRLNAIAALSPPYPSD